MPNIRMAYIDVSTSSNSSESLRKPRVMTLISKAALNACQSLLGCVILSWPVHDSKWHCFNDTHYAECLWGKNPWPGEFRSSKSARSSTVISWSLDVPLIKIRKVARTKKVTRVEGDESKNTAYCIAANLFGPLSFVRLGTWDCFEAKARSSESATRILRPVTFPLRPTQPHLVSAEAADLFSIMYLGYIRVM